MNTNLSAQSSSKPRLTSILGAFLETAIHELIYLRSLYPHDAFSPSRHLQISVHACRHPSVVNYIFNTLNVAVPSIVNGFIDGLYLIFYDEASGVLFERYGFEFDLCEATSIHEFNGDDGSLFASTSAKTAITSEKEDVAYKVQELERSLRDVLLSIISLDGTNMGRKRGRTNFTDTTTFKICLHTKEIDNDGNNATSQMTPNSASSFDNNNKNNEFCPELKDAIESGQWLRSDTESCQLSSRIDSNKNTTGTETTGGIDAFNRSKEIGGCITRPLKSLNAPSCGIKMQVMIDLQG